VEAIDNHDIERKVGDAPLRAEWRPDLLGGVVVVKGKWADGSELLAVPNYARMNRVGAPREYPADEEPGFDRKRKPSIDSKVWI
jgi:hypothetical protein